MFQAYDDQHYTTNSAERIARLREELNRAGIDGFVVPRGDEYQGEYVAPYAERLQWLTGFSGSAGTTIILLEAAAIFVDGRYTLQAQEQVDIDVFDVVHLADHPPGEWLERNLKPGQKLGFDPWLHTMDQVDRLTTSCTKARAELHAVKTNPIDTIWRDQPSVPHAPVHIHQIQYSGVHARAKLTGLAETLQHSRADACVLTLPDSIAWAFNIRGNDIPHTPVCLAFAILNANDKANLFIAPEKLDDTVRDYLEDFAELSPPDQLLPKLRDLGQSAQAVMIDPAWTPHAIGQMLTETGARVIKGKDPCILPKAIKNSTEIAGARTAHERDGVAMSRFLAWIDREAPKGRLDEVKAAKQLELFRTETGKLRDVSFATISGFGPNGAVVHYRVTEATCRKFTGDGLYLVDSGGQYLDGTTDITRTVAIGTPKREMRERFTRVLKGHIAIARARFPRGTTGTQLDTLARAPLWEVGIDFDHGTGHGVGSYLSVHEGPQRISKLGYTKLEPGMIISNEPGYYKTGEYGIRIENLILVRELEKRPEEEREMLGFETLSFVPIDLRLIDKSLLSPDETAWLDDYHGQVLDLISPRLRDKDRTWLETATAPLGRSRPKPRSTGGGKKGWFGRGSK